MAKSISFPQSLFQISTGEIFSSWMPPVPGTVCALQSLQDGLIPGTRLVSEPVPTTSGITCVIQEADAKMRLHIQEIYWGKYPFREGNRSRLENL